MTTGHGERFVRQVIDQAGLQLVAISRTGSGHYKATVAASDGRQESQIFSGTASDNARAVKNMLAQLRRFARGHSSIHHRSHK